MAWVNPRYQELTGQAPPAPRDSTGQAAPDDQGERLVTLPRSSRAGEEELRVSLAEYQGHPYLSLRVWARDSYGQFWPLKNKGVSVRLSEAQDVAEALMAGLRIAEQGRPPAPASKPAARPSRQPARGQQQLPERAAGGSGFSEFD